MTPFFANEAKKKVPKFSGKFQLPFNPDLEFESSHSPGAVPEKAPHPRCDSARKARHFFVTAQVPRQW